MFSVKDILEATEGEMLKGGAEVRFSCVSTDTRTIKQGALFIAIKGPNFDGHNFIEEARSKGAIGAVVNSPSPRPLPIGERSKVRGFDFVIIEVKDTVKALGDIAKFHRKRFDIPVIAITGSNGKTTAKEMLATILAGKYKVLKNEGTENNFIGVPRTLLKLDSNCEIAVIELGSNHFGEIARLAEVVQPNCAVILNIGPSHLEFFDTIENVREEKISLLKRLGNDGIAVVNGDDAELVKSAKALCDEVRTFGLSEGCDFFGSAIIEESSGTQFLLGDSLTIELKILGRHNIYNALASIAVGSLYGLKVTEMAETLEGFKLPKMRMEMVETAGVKFIFDCYNSNPASMSGAIETTKNMDTSKRKIIVAGDMLELGKAGADLHREVGRLAARAKVDILVGVGPLSRFILEGAREEGKGGTSLLHFENSLDAATALKDILKEGDLVLVKGSRGMKMEEIKRCFTTCSTR